MNDTTCNGASGDEFTCNRNKHGVWELRSLTTGQWMRHAAGRADFQDMYVITTNHSFQTHVRLDRTRTVVGGVSWHTSWTDVLRAFPSYQ